jgi:halimadienyl-diphosphate synthase
MTGVTGDVDSKMDLSRDRIQAAAWALLDAVVADQREGWGGGLMTAAPYDVAWVARVREPREPGRLAFPETLAWLVTHQAPDGSWGSAFPHTLLPTMAGLLALRKAPAPPAAVEEAAARAEGYLRQALGQWAVHRHESVGFEVVAPRLLLELAEAGVALQIPGEGGLASLHREKLMLAGPDLIYRGESNLIHSLEAFGPALDFARIKHHQAENGSYGCSPAATAAVLIFAPEWDERAACWLRGLSERAFGGTRGGMPNAYPIDAFEGAWVLYNLAEGGVLGQRVPPALPPLCRWLEDCVTPGGASISRCLGLPTDSDDTGVVLAALLRAGRAVGVESLLAFEREAHFACFQRERGASVSANAHVLAALNGLPVDQRSSVSGAIAKLTEFLYGARSREGFWTDKWHVSPYYATASAVLALSGCGGSPDLRRLGPSLSWILGTQRPDGGWGWAGQSTLEETAYAMQTLQVGDDLADAVSARALDRAFGWLWERFWHHFPDGGAGLPQQWLGKETYTPIRVVFSAALGALHRHADRTRNSVRP